MNKLSEIGEHKWIFLIAGGTLLLGVMWWMFRADAIPVETAHVEVGEMLVTIDGEGRTRFRDKVTVTAPVGGKLTRVKLREGDRLPKGYVITEVDPTPPQTRPPQELEGRVNASAWKVYSPIDGRLLKIWEPNDRIVAAGTPIVDIGNPGLTEIVVDVLSTDAVNIKPGAVVLIDRDQAAEQLEARVRTTEPQAFTKVSALGVEEQRVNIVIDQVPAEIGVGDNFRVDVRIIVWRGSDVLQVPSSALFRDGEEWSVFVRSGRRAQLRQITVGHMNASTAEVLGGLDEGEYVVLHPPNDLTDGARVAEE